MISQKITSGIPKNPLSSGKNIIKGNPCNNYASWKGYIVSQRYWYSDEYVKWLKDWRTGICKKCTEKHPITEWRKFYSDFGSSAPKLSLTDTLWLITHFCTQLSTIVKSMKISALQHFISSRFFGEITIKWQNPPIITPRNLTHIFLTPL